MIRKKAGATFLSFAFMFAIFIGSAIMTSLAVINNASQVIAERVLVTKIMSIANFLKPLSDSYSAYSPTQPIFYCLNSSGLADLKAETCETDGAIGTGWNATVDVPTLPTESTMELIFNSPSNPPPATPLFRTLSSTLAVVIPTAPTNNINPLEGQGLTYRPVFNPYNKIWFSASSIKACMAVLDKSLPWSHILFKKDSYYSHSSTQIFGESNGLITDLKDFKNFYDPIHNSNALSFCTDNVDHNPTHQYPRYLWLLAYI